MIQVKSRARVILEKISHSPKSLLAFVSIAFLSGLVLLLAFWVSAESVTEVTTLPATEIGQTSARLRGTALSSPTATRGFQLGETTAYGIEVQEDYMQYTRSDVQWGTLGTGNGQFREPADVAVDSSGNVYVLETHLYNGNPRVQKFSATGTYITQWGSTGFGDGQFINPENIYIDRNDNDTVYVAEEERIQKFTSNGVHISTIAPNYGSGDGEFSGIAGVATDSLGNIYVVDVFNERIQKLDSNGAYISQWSQDVKTGGGAYNHHTDLVVDSNDNVYVGDFGHGKIRRFTSNGVFISEWQAISSTYGTGPSYLAIDSDDNIYVSFSEGEHQVYTADGVSLATWSEPIPLNSGFWGIAIGLDDRIYSADFESQEIISFMNLIETFVPIQESPDLECETTYHFRAYATSGATTIYGEDQTFTTEACDPVLRITTELLPDETIGVAYSQNIETENYNGVVDFYLDGGTLPPGLNIGSSNLNGFTGQLSGTPTQVGEYTFTIGAADTLYTDTQQYTITINAPADEDEPLQITPTALSDGTVGSSYSYGLEAVNGNGPLTWSISAGALDEGLDLGAGNGLITGTPVLEGLYTVTFSVTDGDDTANQQFTHLVNPLVNEPPDDPPTDPPVSPPVGTPAAPKAGAGIFALIIVVACIVASAIIALFNAIKKWEIKEHSDK